MNLTDLEVKAENFFQSSKKMKGGIYFSAEDFRLGRGGRKYKMFAHNFFSCEL